jgi:hypothetical protein
MGQNIPEQQIKDRTIFFGGDAAAWDSSSPT